MPLKKPIDNNYDSEGFGNSPTITDMKDKGYRSLLKGFSFRSELLNQEVIGLWFLCRAWPLMLSNILSAKDPGWLSWLPGYFPGILVVLYTLDIIGAPIFEALLLNRFFNRIQKDKILIRTFNHLITSISYVLAVGLGLIFLIIPGLVIAKRYIFAPMISANELLNPIQSFKKSYVISRKIDNRWRIFRRVLFLSLLYVLISAGMDYIISSGDLDSSTIAFGTVFMSLLFMFAIQIYLIDKYRYALYLIKDEQRIKPLGLKQDEVNLDDLDSDPDWKEKLPSGLKEFSKDKSSSSLSTQRLEELKDLFERGLISENEYETLRRKSLGL